MARDNVLKYFEMNKNSHRVTTDNRFFSTNMAFCACFYLFLLFKNFRLHNIAEYNKNYYYLRKTIYSISSVYVNMSVYVCICICI